MSTLPNRALAWVVVVALVVGAGSLAANQAFQAAETREHGEALTGGNVDRGRQTFIAVGCGGCHTATGVAQANGLVGPPLDGIAERAVIAGKLANNPANLERWISSPQSFVPGNAMPDLGVTPGQARDIAAFLYTRT